MNNEKLIHIDLFSGIGGFALAADRVFGNVEHIFCDNEPFAKEVLKKHWPDASIYGDIRSLTYADCQRHFTGGLKSSQQKDHTKHSVNLSQALNHPLFSLVGSPANLSPKLDEGAERRMTASSGRRCYESYESFLHYGSLLKTCVAFLLKEEVWYSSVSALTWKPLVTKSNRLLFQLSPSVRHTGETGSGLLPTAQASDASQGAVIGKHDRFYMTKGLPRKINENGKDGSVGLARLMLLKTPSASEGEGGWKVDDKYWNAKAPKLKMRDQVGRHTGLKLQPAFVEWMMGFPEGWTEISDSKFLEMRLSRKSRKK